MRLSVPMVAQDNAKYGYRDALQELKYCGFDVPERKEITNENIRFYAWLCRMAVSMLKLKDCEIKRLEAKQPMKVVYDMNPMTRLPVSFCPSCGYAVDRYAYGRNDLPQVFCPYCGQALDWKDGEQECQRLNDCNEK